MSALPKISIVTPSYNQGKFIARTIESVLFQDYPNLEYIVMDGGSTDDSAEIIQSYGDRLTYWCSEPDDGQTDAIVKGMSRATGDILGYLNSDDVLLPNALLAVAETLNTNEEEWAIGQQQIIDENDNLLALRPVYPFSLSDLWHNQYLVPQECTFFTRRLYDRVGGFQSTYRYAMDMHAWLRMCSVCPPKMIAGYVGCFRVHSEQKSSRMDKYFEEAETARTDVEKWRIENQMQPHPGKPPLRGPLFRAAKACFYLRRGGPKMLRDIWSFQRNYRY